MRRRRARRRRMVGAGTARTRRRCWRYLEEPLELSAVVPAGSRAGAGVDGRSAAAARVRVAAAGALPERSCPRRPPVAVAAADGAAARLQQENLFWQSILGSRNAADFGGVPRLSFPMASTAPWRRIVWRSCGRPQADAGPPPARSSPGSVFRDCPGCPEMVVVPPGRFRMGCVSGRNCCFDSRTSGARRVGWRRTPSVEVRGHVRRSTTASHADTGSPPTRRSGSGPWPPARDRRPLGRCGGIRRRGCRRQTGRAVSSAKRGGVGVRGPGGNDDTRTAGAMTSDATGRIARGCGSRWDADRTAPVGSFAANDCGIARHGGQPCMSGYKTAGTPTGITSAAPPDGSAWTTGGDCSLRIIRGRAVGMHWPSCSVSNTSAPLGAAGSATRPTVFAWRGRSIKKTVQGNIYTA